MKTKNAGSHTPGPWFVGWRNRPGLIWAGEKSNPIFLCEVSVSLDHKNPDDTNARLIAAAPELLAQLKRILAMHDCKNNGMYNGEAVLSKSVADEIRAAIAKAEGSSHE